MVLTTFSYGWLQSCKSFFNSKMFSILCCTLLCFYQAVVTMFRFQLLCSCTVNSFKSLVTLFFCLLLCYYSNAFITTFLVSGTTCWPGGNVYHTSQCIFCHELHGNANNTCLATHTLCHILNKQLSCWSAIPGVKTDSWPVQNICHTGYTGMVEPHYGLLHAYSVHFGSSILYHKHYKILWVGCVLFHVYTWCESWRNLVDTNCI